MPRKYTGQPGDSFTFNGESYTADKKGVIKVGDDVPHEEMLSHGFSLAGDQDADDAAPKRSRAAAAVDAPADDQPQA
jgi:hypothetical protein